MNIQINNPKFAVLTDNMKQAIKAIYKNLPSESSQVLPSSAHVQVSTYPGYISFDYYSPGNGVITSVEVGAKVENPGTLTLPVKTFYQIMATYSDTVRMDFSYDADTFVTSIRVSDMRTISKFNLRGFDIDEMPPVPDMNHLEHIATIDLPSKQQTKISQQLTQFNRYDRDWETTKIKLRN